MVSRGKRGGDDVANVPGQPAATLLYWPAGSAYDRPMDPEPGKLKIAGNGSVVLNQRARELLSDGTTEYRLSPGPGRALWLSPADSGSQEVALAGEFGGAIGAPDVVSILTQFGLRGELTITARGVTRRFQIEQGALRSVATDAPSERLGALMVSSGMVGTHQLEDCLAELRAPARLGDVVLARKLLDEQQLFELLRRQASQTFQNGLLVTRGHYAFTPIAEEDTFDMPFSVHMPLQALLMESLQRVDEMRVFREHMPNDRVRPRPQAGSEIDGLSDELQAVVTLASGKHTLADIGRLLELDEYETMRRVYQLVRRGALTVSEEDDALDQQLERLVQRFNGALDAISRELDRHGADLDLGATLMRCKRDASHAALLDGALSPDGRVCASSLLDYLRAVPEGRRQAAATEALHDLISFALFSAGRALPRSVETALNQRVQRMLLG